jgi:hypothetical protein
MRHMILAAAVLVLVGSAQADTVKLEIRGAY